VPPLPAGGVAGNAGLDRNVRDTFRRTPTEMRRLAKPRAANGDGGVRLRITYRPPYDWDAMWSYLAARATPGVERVGSGRYRRSVVVDGKAAVLEVVPEPAKSALALSVSAPVRRDLIDVIERVPHGGPRERGMKIRYATMTRS
jgi:AraC family transcriptional regulator of adaptative response / DNA-3-methyladenine glycosylase II